MFCEDQINNQVKVISQCFVKPKYEVAAAKQPYYLSPNDLIFLTFDQIQKGLLYSTKPKNIQTDFLETLKDSLAVSLVHYYPLAGRFTTEHLPDENAKWVYLDCTKGPGALLTHATVEDTVSNILFSVDVHPIVRLFFDLGQKTTNYDGHTRPLLSIQVTELIDGIFIGFTMNHSVVDGNTQWHFINSLSEIFLQFIANKEHENDVNSIIISRKPVFKPYFPDGWGPVLKLCDISVNVTKTWTKDQVVLRERIYHFSSKSMRKLKAKANEEGGVNIISSFQALSAFMWRCITRARHLQPELETSCGLIMNVRLRLNPPLSDDHFGNLITRQKNMCSVGELLSNDLGWAAMLVHQIVASEDNENVNKFYEMTAKFLCEGPTDLGRDSPAYCPNMVLIGGLARFDSYRAEFGIGKAEAVLAGYCGKEDGKVTASPGREDGGSVDLEVCLTPETMNALELDNEFMSFATHSHLCREEIM